MNQLPVRPHQLLIADHRSLALKANPALLKNQIVQINKRGFQLDFSLRCRNALAKRAGRPIVNIGLTVHLLSESDQAAISEPA